METFIPRTTDENSNDDDDDDDRDDDDGEQHTNQMAQWIIHSNFFLDPLLQTINLNKFSNERENYR